MPRYRTFHHLEEYLVSNLPYRTYSISLKKAQPRSEEGVHKEGEETVMIKLVDQEDLRVRKEREGKLALEEKKAGGQLHSNRLYIGLDENSVLTNITSFHSVVVITCASHAHGRRFDPGRKQLVFLISYYFIKCLDQQ